MFTLNHDAAQAANTLVALAEADQSETWHAECLGQVFNIRGEPSAVDEIRTFFGPFYPVLPGGSETAESTVFLLQHGLPAAGQPLRDMRCYVEAADPAPAGCGRSLFTRPGTDILVLADPARKRVIVCGSHPEELGRQGRVLIRDQLFGEIERAAGYIAFHSSAVGADGRAAVFIGNRGAGKTTSQLSLLASGAFGFVGADRVKLRPGGGGVEVLGVPSRSTVDPRALSNDSFLRPYAAGLTELAHGGKHIVDHRALLDWSGRPAVPRSTLGLVATPRLSADGPPLTLQRVRDPARVRAVLRANLMDGTPDDTLVPWLGWYERAATEASLERCLDAVARTVPVVEVRATYTEYRRTLERRGLAMFSPALDES